MSWRHRALFSAVLMCSCLIPLGASAVSHRPLPHPLPAPPFEVRHLDVLAPGAGVQGNLTPTPEPASLLLFGSGLLILGGAIRRHNKKKVDRQAQGKASGVTADSTSQMDASAASSELC